MTPIARPIHGPSKEDLRAAVNKTVPDVIAPGLKILFCGINPGLYTAAVGHHFARPGNRFWKALFDAGFTDRLLAPEEERRLLESGYGITNLVARASLAAAEVTKEELAEGGRILESKVRNNAPRWLAMLGMGAYQTAFGRPRAALGPQPETIGETRIWVLPNTSGLNANYRPADFARVFRELRLAADETARETTEESA